MEAGADILIRDGEGWALSDIARSHKNMNLYSIIFD
jgi:hypothetical protein